MTTSVRRGSVVRSGERTVAKVITEVLAPAILVIGILMVVAIRNLHRSSEGSAAWAGVAILLCAGVPMAYVLRGVRAGRWADHHVASRAHRRIPLLVGSCSIAAAGVLLIVVRAPSELIALVVAQFVVLVTVAGITHYWKISVHTATAGGVVGILTALYGPWALLGLLAVALIGWSRMVLGAHNRDQLIAGAVVGFPVAVILFPLLS